MGKVIRKYDWRPLYFLNIFRILISGLFVSFFYFELKLSPFGIMEPQMFHITSMGYLVVGIIIIFTIRKQWPSFPFQTHGHLLLDIGAILLLMHSSGGVSSGVGLLLIIPIAASGIFLYSLFSYFYAALASILILFDQFYLFLSFSFYPAYPQAGILGGILFFTALLTNYLIRKIQDTEALANQIGEDLADMENIAGFVMQRLQTPVMVVNNMGRIRLKNEAASKLLNRLENQDSHKSYEKLTDFSPTLSALFHKWLKHPETPSESFNLENTSIKILPQFSPLQKKNTNDAIVFLEDISKINQQAQQLKLASLGRLTASIAHEIRNPLSAISHASELLSESESIHEMDQRLTKIIDKQSQRVNGIIDTVLSLSRRNEPKTEYLDLKKWLENFLLEQIQFSTEHIEIHAQNAEKACIHFDPQHLQQILSNLIQNALIHREISPAQPEKNKVQINIIDDLQTKNVILQVINYGESIKSDDIPHLFEPFFTTKTNGTGLGLYMSKELADSNHATLDYIPYRDKTCFQLKFIAI